MSWILTSKSGDIDRPNLPGITPVAPCVGGLIIWSVIAVVFFKWYQVEQRDGWDELKWRDVERDVRSQLSRGRG